MSDVLPADAVLQLRVSELDHIIDQATPQTDPETTLEAAEQAGQTRTAEFVHHEITTRADVIIE